ncbi:carboxylating nicotinate-nucleotide diphosphorylase [Sphingobium xenophagum]|nr:carboxylating nicotinate-nucleotide diphosphorylase [Sphingobium xenophagum]KFL46185.1 nicotinate-nucleotide pyrophosphorylase (carboxylating) [Sphingobium sp. ba1]
MIAGLDQQQLDNFVDYVLSEDLGSGDVTSRVSVPASARFSAVLAARQPIVVAGLQLAAAFFGKLDPEVAIEFLVQDGDNVAAGQPLMRIAGSAQLMLAAERSALNTLQHLTGIATVTRSYAEAIAGTDCVLLDTRKTIPGLRAIEKYAAKVGGARNHRMRLDDGILIKDNHIAAAGSIVEAVKAAKAANTGLEVQVEVDGIEQIEPALMAGADRLLCDNMSPAKLKEAVALVGGRVPIEASGGVRLDTIREIASTGVDFVSVGRITQSAPAADIGLDYALSP